MANHDFQRTAERPIMPATTRASDLIATNLSRYSHEKGSPESYVSLADEKDFRSVAATNQVLSVAAEFREASVPANRLWLLVISVCLGLFLSIADTSIVATSMYTIGLHFNDMKTINWIALAYTLAYLSCAVTFARVADVVGRRGAFMAAYLIFFIFSLACGFSRSLPQLIAFRALQGIGGSGLYSLALIILPELSPRHLTPHISSIIGLVIACSGAAGPVLGGLLTEYATWRWIFWINGPVGALSMACFCLAWPTCEQLPTLEKRRWRDFDWIGTFLIISAALLIVFPFQNAGENGPRTWMKPVFVVPFTLGVLCLVVLMGWEHVAQVKFKGRVLLAFPLNLFSSFQYLSSVVVTFLTGFPYLLIIYSFPIRLQVIGQKTPLLAGLMLLPMLGTLAIGATLNGVINKVKNFTAETQLVGTILLTLGCGLMIMVKGPEDDSVALGFLVILGLGLGLAFGSASLFTLFECPISDYAPAQGIVAQSRVLGGSLGIAASTALIDRRTSQFLSGHLTESQLPNPEQSTGASSGASSTHLDALSTAYTKAFQDGMILCVALSAVSVLIALSSVYKAERGFVKDLQDGLIEEENRRRSVRPAINHQEVE